MTFENSDLEITAEFQSAAELIQAGSPFTFISGKAGTGKSTFIRYLRSIMDKNIAVVAPTGVAALNVQGQTIHSFFRFPPKLVDPDSLRPIRGRELYQNLDLLIIDEISMVRADLLDGINRFLQLNRYQEYELFGGVQVVVIGDLFQLPPIVRQGEESQIYYDRYDSPWFFEADCFQSLDFDFFEFTQIFRQTDPYFISLLGSIRENEDPENALEEINHLCFNQEITGDNPVTLTTTNAVADRQNARRLADLPDRELCYQGELEGRFNIQQDKLPAPYQLSLKIGAQVMFTKNDPDKRWVNGTLGQIVDLSSTTIGVEIIGSGSVFGVEQVTWEAYSYSYNQEKQKIVSETVGKFKQYPLMLAWAVTIHKSQGQTLNNVYLDLGRGAFACGQVYVALSRCRSLEGISLKKKIEDRDLRADQRVKDFYGRCKKLLPVTY